MDIISSRPTLAVPPGAELDRLRPAGKRKNIYLPHVPDAFVLLALHISNQAHLAYRPFTDRNATPTKMFSTSIGANESVASPYGGTDKARDMEQESDALDLEEEYMMFQDKFIEDLIGTGCVKAEEDFNEAGEMETDQTWSVLAIDVIREWASGSSMYLVEFRSAWLRFNLPAPVYPSACRVILPVFEDLVKFFADTEERKEQEKVDLRTELKARNEGKVRETGPLPSCEEPARAFLPRMLNEGASHGNTDIIIPAFQPPIQTGWTSSSPVPKMLAEPPQKRLTSQDMIGIARAHSASSAVAHVAKLHAFLIANGICGEFTRNR